MTLLTMTLFFMSVLLIFGTTKMIVAVSSKWDNRKELELPKAEVVTAEMCSLYEVRHTQLKMLDAGILTDDDISVCSDLACPNCKATRETQERSLRRVTMNEYKRMNQERLAQRMALAQRVRRVGGFEVTIPEVVPSFASAKLDYDPKFMRNLILWTWTDQATGRQMQKTQLMAREWM